MASAATHSITICGVFFSSVKRFVTTLRRSLILSSSLFRNPDALFNFTSTARWANFILWSDSESDCSSDLNSPLFFMSSFKVVATSSVLSTSISAGVTLSMISLITFTAASRWVKSCRTLFKGCSFSKHVFIRTLIAFNCSFTFSCAGLVLSFVTSAAFWPTKVSPDLTAVSASLTAASVCSIAVRTFSMSSSSPIFSRMPNVMVAFSAMSSAASVFFKISSWTASTMAFSAS
mmetsp:Transcript_91361/g.258030  ORF Transcript_91361/g.258030 Transcript_91361/m.258030 type:complete len:233 (-) Transcript_91361:910-1608(-)